LHSVVTEIPADAWSPAAISAACFREALENQWADFGSEHAFPRPKEHCHMFRACYSDTDAQRWSLHGRLAGPWVDELRSCWKQARERAPLARAIVDLKEVTFIDQAGEKLLAEMRGAGAELIATGVEHRHLLALLDNDMPDNHAGAPESGKAPEGEDK
jgi:hypothetical protein